MSDISISEARAHWARVVDEAAAGSDPVYVTRRGRRVAAVVDADYLEWLVDLAENISDVAAARAARAQMSRSGEAAIPWDQVKADLGVT